ncbi:nitroreductase family deazaflavin-dependent oxidoreductase [Oceanicoccus sp. KOV_DT_Chl]|uniref:nitroreductase family deazaflavin-dependent oxidoreductase n=1 Tax=Oceanicoccus sp. KOV_DT_Chl TaxID=1904639 RepID=UPI000C7DC16C|nr:nitroreductase family deazaflavin-dependent oxidoreductase [Oceanicoccus sp. KOV_DT_Chl]
MTQFDYVKTRREDIQAIPPASQEKAKVVIRWLTRLNVAVFKASKGRLWKNFIGGYPICVVGMTGKKSGKFREVALIHLPKGDDVLLVASQGGMDTHPVWYYNLKANPNIEVTVGGTTRQMVARQVDDDEKRELWPHLLSLYPDFDEYQARTDRNIPVFVCSEV